MFQSPLRKPLIEGTKTYRSITSDILNPMMKRLVNIGIWG